MSEVLIWASREVEAGYYGPLSADGVKSLLFKAFSLQIVKKAAAVEFLRRTVLFSMAVRLIYP